MPDGPRSLPRVSRDLGVVVAGWLSVPMAGPVALIVMVATAGRASAFRRFQLEQAVLAQSLAMGLLVVPLIAVASGAEGALVVLVATVTWIPVLLLPVFVAAWLAARGDLVLPVLGPALFAMRYANVPAEVPVEPPDPDPLPPGPFGDVASLPRRPNDAAVAALGHVSVIVYAGLMPALLLSLSHRASPYLRFHLIQASVYQLVTVLALPVLMVLAGVVGALVASVHETAGFAVWVLGSLVAVLLQAGAPMVFGVAVLRGADLLVPLIGPWILRRWINGAS